MSSEKYVRIILAESLRFLEEGSSAPSKSGAKVRPKGVADAHTVARSQGTEIQVRKCSWTRARKAL